MAIHINLLAEQQAAEEMRRRDPVKRAMWAGGLIVGAMAVWSAQVQIKLMGVMREVRAYNSEWKKLEPLYTKVTADFEKAAEAERKWDTLQALAINRFLWATPLNALQFVIADVDGVRVTRLKTDQSYTFIEGIKPSTNAVGVVSRGRPPASREKVMLTIDAKDSSKRPGEQVTRFQEAINNNSYFKSNLQKTELTGRSRVQGDAGNPGKSFVTFTLECQYPEKVH